MIPRYLADVMAELPYKLRDEVEGYVNAVDAVAVDIARESGIRLTSVIREDFLFLVGIRRLWSTINSSHWLAANSAELFKRAEVPRVQAGSLCVGPGEEFNRELRRLRDGLQALLEEHELDAPVNMGHVSDVMVWVTERIWESGRYGGS